MTRSTLEGERIVAEVRTWKRGITLRLDPAETHALDLVAGNGWGSGDFAEWLESAGSPELVKPCQDAMDALGRGLGAWLNRYGKDIED